MLISDPQQVLIRCTHMSIDDETAETLIDGLIESVGAEIRTLCRQRRQTEKDLMRHRAECSARDSIVSAGIIARHEAEKVSGRLRNEELARAESRRGN